MTEKSRYFEPLATEVATGVPIRQAAVRIRCCESTAYRIAATTEFKTKVSELRTAGMDSALGKLSETAGRAVEALAELLGSDDDSIRLRAAVSILDRFTKISEQIDVRQRLEEIEKRVQGQDGQVMEPVDTGSNALIDDSKLEGIRESER